MAGIRDKFQKMINPPDDEYEEYYDDEQENEYSSSGRSSYLDYDRHDSRSDRLVSLDSKAQAKMVVCKPSAFGEEVRDIADELLDKHTVVLNLEKADKESARRIVDFLSGVAYANHGKLKPIASNIVIVTPYNVDLTGDDVLDELESSGIYF